MVSKAANEVPDLIANVMTRYRVPGIVVVASGPGGALYDYAAGTDANGRLLEVTSIFPIASITKLATALTILVLADRGLLDLDEPISVVIPDAVAAKSGVTARRLLSHTGGLPYDLPESADPSSLPTGWNGVVDRCLRTNLVAPPGSMVQYGNVGYGLLAIIAERVLKISIQDAVTTLVIEPLGIEASLGRIPNRPSVVVSDVRGPGVRTETGPFNSTDWYKLGLPWSGAMATPDAALGLLNAFAGGGPSPIRQETAAEARRNQTENLGGGFAAPLRWAPAWWGLGPDLKDDKRPHWTPEVASPATFGHAGGSGVLAYYDPTRRVGWAIFGSRTADNGWLLRAGPTIGAALLRLTDPA